MTFHILGMLSSQLTNSIIFQRGRAQPATSHDFGRFFPCLQKGWEGSTLGWTNRVTKWHGPPSRVFHQGKSPVQRVQSRFFLTIPVTFLVGGLEHGFYDFPYVGKFIIPTDFHIFQRGWNHQPEDVISPSWWLRTFETPLLVVFLPDNSLDWKCWLAFPRRYSITSLRTHHVASYKKPVPGLGMNHARLGNIEPRDSTMLLRWSIHCDWWILLVFLLDALVAHPMAIPSGELWKTWPYRKFDDLPINSMVIFHIYAGWWFGTWLDYDFPQIGNVIIVIIPTDELTHSMIFQRGRSTTNQVVDGQLTANPRNPWWISMDFMGPTSTLWSLWRGPKKPMRSEFGVQSHGGSPQKHASHMDFPWNKPSSCWGSPMTMETPLSNQWSKGHPRASWASSFRRSGS